MIGFQPIIESFDHGRVTTAKCSGCGKQLQLDGELTTVEDHDRRLKEAFEDHMRAEHPQTQPPSAMRQVRRVLGLE